MQLVFFPCSFVYHEISYSSDKTCEIWSMLDFLFWNNNLTSSDRCQEKCTMASDEMSTAGWRKTFLTCKLRF